MIMLTALAMLVQISPGSVPSKDLVAPDGQKVKCRLVQEPHSRIPNRVCRTKAEWARIAAEAEADLASSRNDIGAGALGMLEPDQNGRVVQQTGPLRPTPN